MTSWHIAAVSLVCSRGEDPDLQLPTRRGGGPPAAEALRWPFGQRCGLWPGLGVDLDGPQRGSSRRGVARGGATAERCAGGKSESTFATSRPFSRGFRR